MVIIVKVFLYEAFWKAAWPLAWVMGGWICRVKSPKSKAPRLGKSQAFFFFFLLDLIE